MQLDTQTVLFFVMLLCGSQAVVTLLFYRLARQYKGVFAWTLGNLAVALGYILAMWRGMIPDFLSIVVANAALMTAPWFFWVGMRRFLDQPVRIRSLVWLPLCGTALIVYFTFFVPDLSTRALIATVVHAILYIATGVTILIATETRTRFSYRFTGFVFSSFGTFYIVRLYVLLQEPAQDIFAPTPIQTTTFILTALSVIMWTTGFAVMITERLLIELQFTATHDFLTRTLNRRAAHAALETEISRSLRTNTAFSVLLLDIDHFKQINDRYGHVVGDKVLAAVAANLMANVRHGDLVARWGGEEFLVILTASGVEGALIAAHRLCERIHLLPLPFAATHIPCTISIGTATFVPHVTTLQEVITCADVALYHAKHRGRNCVVSYNTDLEMNVAATMLTALESSEVV